MGSLSPCFSYNLPLNCLRLFCFSLWRSHDLLNTHFPSFSLLTAFQPGFIQYTMHGSLNKNDYCFTHLPSWFLAMWVPG